MAINAKDRVINRLKDQARQSGKSIDEVVGMAEEARAPRWRVDSQNIEFECGCVGRRFKDIYWVQNYDPIIFKDLPEQAVYYEVCSLHLAEMNKRVKFGGFTDFQQWRDNRFRIITGEVF